MIRKRKIIKRGSSHNGLKIRRHTVGALTEKGAQEGKTGRTHSPSSSPDEADDGQMRKNNEENEKQKMQEDKEEERTDPHTVGLNFDEKGEVSAAMVKERIQEVVHVLANFKVRAEPGRKRIEYRKLLLKDLCSFYGYNEFLMEKFMELFPNGAELLEFLDSNEQPRPVTIHSNPLKTCRGDLAKSLISRGMNVDPADK